MQWNVPRVESTEVFSKNFVLIFLYKLKRVKKILNESATIYDCCYEYTDEGFKRKLHEKNMRKQENSPKKRKMKDVKERLIIQIRVSDVLSHTSRQC